MDHREFKEKMPYDYYQVNVVESFKNSNIDLNYDKPISQRNKDKQYRLTLNHIEMIEYFVRLIKPKNFLELGVQFGETTRRIIPHIKETYYAVDIYQDENMEYFKKTYDNFIFSNMTTDSFFKYLDNNNINLKLEMVFIDACHSYEATYRDFLNVQKHLVNDGIVFMHDMYPKDLKSTSKDLSGDTYKTAEKIRLNHNYNFEILTIPVEPGLSILRKVDRQLNWLPSNYGFIVTSYLSEQKHLISLNNCLNSIIKNNPNNKIVVIVDHKSDISFIEQAKNSFSNRNVIFDISNDDIRADMLTLDYYYKKRYFDKAIIIQDSMKLKNKIDPSRVDDILYLWYATNHRLQWNVINEPKSDYNTEYNIITHEDLISHIIDTKIQNLDFKKYCEDIYSNKDKWCVCFGGCCIITHDFLVRLNDLTGIIDLQKQMNTRRLAMVFESLFSIACQYVTQRSMECAYDGLYYDGVKGNNLDGRVISKVSFLR